MDNSIRKVIRNKRKQAKTKNNVLEKFIGSKSQNDSIRLIFLKELHCHISITGKIYIWRWDNGKKIWQAFDDIQTAIRAQQHILGNFFFTENAEVKKIIRNLTVVEESKCAILDWKKNTPEMLKVIEGKLERVSQSFARCRNRLKVESQKQLNKATSLTDSLGRKNPGATAARITAAELRLEKRKGIVEDDLGEFIFSRLNLLILEEKQMILNQNLAAFKIKMLTNSSTKLFQNKNAAKTIINEIIFLLRSVWINPYFMVAQETIKLLEEAKILINQNKAKTSLEKIQEAFDFTQKPHSCIQ